MNELLTYIILYAFIGLCLSMFSTDKLEAFARKMANERIPLWFKRFFAQMMFIALWPMLIGDE